MKRQFTVLWVGALLAAGSCLGQNAPANQNNPAGATSSGQAPRPSQNNQNLPGFARGMVPVTGAAPIELNQVPAEVRRILRDQAAGGTIQAVTKGQWQGQPVYTATLLMGGHTRQVQVEGNGTILNGPHGAITGRRGAMMAKVVPLTGTTVIQFSQVPAQVQQVFKKHAPRNWKTQRVLKGQWQGQTVYQTVIAQYGHGEIIQVAEDGTLLSGPFGAQAPGRFPVRSDLAPLTGAAPIDLDQVPAEVQRILRDQARGGTIQAVTKGEWQGQPVFQATITEPNGQTRQVQVEQNGTILNGPPKAARPFNR